MPRAWAEDCISEKTKPTLRWRISVLSDSPIFRKSTPSIQTSPALGGAEAPENMKERSICQYRRPHHGQEFSTLDVKIDTAQSVYIYFTDAIGFTQFSRTRIISGLLICQGLNGILPSGF